MILMIPSRFARQMGYLVFSIFFHNGGIPYDTDTEGNEIEKER